MPGVYIHIPFCDGKCPYCDFYSLRGDETLMDRYTAALCEAVRAYQGAGLAADTVYFGGGTPNLLGARRLGRVLDRVRQAFAVSPQAEITVESNPGSVSEDFFRAIRWAGFNRLSLGLQSANGEELRFLGRRHTPEDGAKAVAAARAAGFENISLDLMLGLPGGSQESLRRSIDFAAGLGVEHLSAYILKVEEGTPFAARGIQLPEDDETAGQYLFLVEELAKRGYPQYEISNFARPGFESRHNLIYWRGGEYLGFGPGAHSFRGGRRCYYPRDLDAFLQGAAPVDDGPGGDFSETVMLALRLTEGLTRQRCRERFGPAGETAFDGLLERAKSCPAPLIRADRDRVAFTPEGFLVSNALLGRILE